MIFYTPALLIRTIIIAASSSAGGIPNLHGSSVDISTPTQRYDTFAANGEERRYGSFNHYQNSYQKVVLPTTSNEYEKVLSKYPSRQDLGLYNSIRPFAYSPALQSRRTRGYQLGPQGFGETRREKYKADL